MFPVIAILVLLLTALVMLTLRLAKPSFAYHWLIAASGSLAALPLVLASGLSLPGRFALPSTILSFQTDRLSWPLAAGIAAAAFAGIYTAATQMSRRDWPAWSGSLTICAFGLTAVLAGSPLTLLLAWASLDLVELGSFLSEAPQSRLRLRIVAGFAARSVGILLAVWGTGLAPEGWSRSAFDPLPAGARLFLYLAAGLRLGVLPLNLPFTGELQLPRSLGTALRLVPAAGNIALLARIAAAESAAYTPYLLGLVTLAALYGAWSWATLREEGGGIPYWVLGTAGLALCASLVGLPAAAVSWGAVCIFTGSSLALLSNRRFLYPLMGLALIGLSALPFTPNWQGAELYSLAAGASSSIVDNRLLAILLAVGFLFVHALLLAGCIRHILEVKEEEERPERWVLVIYPLGLAVLPLTHFAAGTVLWPEMGAVTLSEWVGGAAAVLAAGLLWFVSLRRPRLPEIAVSALRRLFSMDWLYSFLWLIYRAIGRVIEGVSGILEGEGGVLWAFVLLALLFTLVISRIAGG